jgi:hypothetical protein
VEEEEDVNRHSINTSSSQETGPEFWFNTDKNGFIDCEAFSSRQKLERQLDMTSSMKFVAKHENNVPAAGDAYCPRPILPRPAPREVIQY